MANLVRYFSTSSAGAGDGTSWADRAALLSSGNWSSTLTSLDFTSDSYTIMVGPGTYSLSQAWGTGLFANPPTAANPIIFAGCDSSGVILSPPDSDWCAAQPAWDDSNMPVIATTTNIATFNNSAMVGLYMLKFTSSGRNGAVIASCMYTNWVIIEQSASNTSATAMAFPTRAASNMVIKMTGSSYQYGLAAGAQLIDNVRIEGNSSASSGDRHGFVFNGTTNTSPGVFQRIVSINNPGAGFHDAGSNAANTCHLRNCLFDGNTGNGVTFASTASPTSTRTIYGLVATNNGGYGIDAGASLTVIQRSRLRNNTSGNTTGFGNYPTDLRNETGAGSDSDEYVNKASGDYRIKNTAAIWGQGYGAGDEPAAGGGGGGRRSRMRYLGAAA